MLRWPLNSFHRTTPRTPKLSSSAFIKERAFACCSWAICLASLGPLVPVLPPPDVLPPPESRVPLLAPGTVRWVLPSATYIQAHQAETSRLSMADTVHAAVLAGTSMELHMRQYCTLMQCCPASPCMLTVSRPRGHQRGARTLLHACKGRRDPRLLGWLDPSTSQGGLDHRPPLILGQILRSMKAKLRLKHAA